MLAELALALFTRCPPPLRAMGLADESIGLWSRRRRQRAAWGAHEARCHAIVRRSLDGLVRSRTVVVLGSGLVRDVPLADLLARFDTVVLVDAVHLPVVRARFAREPRVRLVTADLSGYAAMLAGTAHDRSAPCAALWDDTVDLVISANILSQIPIGIETFRRRRPEPARRLPADLAACSVRDHLADLAAAPGRICLLTDTMMREHDQAGAVTDTLDLLHGTVLPEPPDDVWDWEVAPFGEVDRRRRYVHAARGYADWPRWQPEGPP